MDDLLCSKDLRVIVEQIHGSAGEILGAQVNFEQCEEQGLPELCVLSLRSLEAVGLCSLGVSPLVNKHLQGLGVFTGPTKENGFLYVQGCWLDLLCDEKKTRLIV